VKKRIDALQPGDLVDLQGDKYADADTTQHPEWEFEFETVAVVEQEAANCFLVHFESGFACGFPPHHEVEVQEGAAS
jgi:hypothetical protein